VDTLLPGDAAARFSCWDELLNLTMSAANLRMPSAVFFVAMASSFDWKRKFLVEMDLLERQGWPRRRRASWAAVRWCRHRRGANGLIVRKSQPAIR